MKQKLILENNNNKVNSENSENRKDRQVKNKKIPLTYI